MKGCVYYILVYGKGYVGITKNSSPERRVRDHIRYQRPIGRAIRKHKSYSVQILAFAKSWERLKQLEIYYIKKYKTKVPYGYNLTDGGEGSLGCYPSKKTRDKMCKNMIGNKHAEGCKQDPKKIKASNNCPMKRRAASQGLKRKWKDAKWREKMLKILMENNQKGLTKHVRKISVDKSTKSNKRS